MIVRRAYGARTGFVTRVRVGRRNAYTVDGAIHMRHPSQFGHEIGELLNLLRLE